MLNVKFSQQIIRNFIYSILYWPTFAIAEILLKFYFLLSKRCAVINNDRHYPFCTYLPPPGGGPIAPLRRSNSFSIVCNKNKRLTGLQRK